jgi:hypothetical protein
VCKMTSGIILRKKNLKRLNVKLNVAQSCLYSKISKQSPLNSTSPSIYISKSVHIGIFTFPRYFFLSVSCLKERYSSIGRPGNRAFSFLRCAVKDAILQYATRIGIKVTVIMIKVALNPPPSFHTRSTGTKKTRENSWMLEKVSEQPPSAGRGPLWIVGTCWWINETIP